jgi:hypothetical protein
VELRVNFSFSSEKTKTGTATAAVTCCGVEGHLLLFFFTLEPRVE